MKSIYLTTLKNCVTLFLCFLIYSPTFTQQLKPEIVLFEEGAGHEIYDIYSDSVGVLWIGSDNGAFKYEGSSLKELKYDENHDQAQVKVFKENGKVWFLNFEGELHYVLKDTLISYKWNESVRHIIRRAKAWMLHFDSEKTLHIGRDNQGYYTIDSNGVLVNHLSYQDYNGIVEVVLPDSFPFVFKMLNKNEYVRDLYYYRFDKYMNLEAKVLLIEEFRKLRDEKLLYDFFDFEKLSTNKTIISTEGNKLILIENDIVKSIKKFPFQIFELFIDKQGGHWVGSYDDSGVHYFENGVFEDGYTSCFDPEKRTTIVRCQDKANGIWVQAENNVYRIPYPRIKFGSSTNKTYEEDEIYALSSSSQGVYSASFRASSIKYISEVNNFEIEEISIPSEYSPMVINNLFYDTLYNRLWVLGRHKIIYKNEEGSWGELKSDRQYFFRGDWLEGIQSPIQQNLAIRGRDKLLIVVDTNIEYAMLQSKNMINDFTYSDDGKLWIAENDGLWTLNDTVYSYYGLRSSHEVLKKKIDNIICYHEKLWITNEKGELYTYSNSKLRKFDKDDTYNLNGTFYSFNDKLYMFKEFSVIEINPDKKEEGSFNEYFLDFGKRLKRQTPITGFKSKLYVGSENGLKILGERELEIYNEPPPIMKINRVKINNKDTTLLDHYSLAYDQNYVRIDFSGIAYPMTRKDVLYRYKFDGIINEWEYTKETSLQFVALPNGNHRLVLQVERGNNNWSPSTSIQFLISKPYWETLWFLSLSILFGVLIVAGTTSYVFKSRKEKVEIELQQVQAEQKALRAQMNPHFLFNVMSSIQYMIKHDPAKSLEYIASYASLIRKILDHSFLSETSLISELQLLENYMKLEQLRFEHKFDYSIVVKDDLKIANIAIPPMLIQPYIENAIHHGLRNKPSNGILEIKVEVNQEGTCVVQIKDNGIGRKQASIYPRNHKGKSYGMLLSNERVKTVNQLGKHKIKIEVEDIDQLEATGTIVTLKIYSKVNEGTNSR